jgi:quercetin dioxygenase-like cupin family protein
MKDIIIREDDQLEWECDPGDENNPKAVRWKQHFTGDKTPTQDISMGTFEVPPGGELALHHHSPQEIYYVFEGEGTLLMEGETKALKAGMAVYIPAGAPHGVRNDTNTMLKIVWMFPTGTWSDVVYHDD